MDTPFLIFAYALTIVYLLGCLALLYAYWRYGVEETAWRIGCALLAVFRLVR